VTISLKPALVSTFIVFDDFCGTGVSYFGNPKRSDNTKRRLHSMVMIGARKNSAGDYFFLLQNWWERKYFIEVSGEYMFYCDPNITFVTKVITRKLELSNFECDALFAETCADAAETCFEC
jgi:hypothetical protein